MVRRRAAATGSGALLAIALGGPHTGWVAFIALVPLLALLLYTPLPPLRAVLLGWGCGVLSTGLHFSYVMQAIHPVIFLGAVAYVGFYTALFAGGVAFCARRSREWACLLAPCLWTALEFMRSHVLTGMPAGTLGASQARVLPILQMASVTGVYGISCFLVVVNLALTRLVLLRRDASSRPAAAWLTGAGIMLAMILGYGLWTLREPEAGAERLRVAAVQGGIDERGLDRKEIRRRIFERYRRLTVALRDEKPELIVYPETMTGSYLVGDSLFLAFLEEMGRTAGGVFLVGSRHLVEEGGRYRLYNSVFLVDATGHVRGRYDKNRLAPFGEYTPLARRLPRLTRFRLSRAELTPGTEVHPVRWPGGPPVGVGICYEAMFGALMRRAVNHGARLLAIVSDDVWFSGTDESRQIFEESIIRAVENRIPVIRCANKGVSGIIDTRGRVTGTPLVGYDDVLHGTVRLRSTTAFYTRFGDVTAWGCCLASLGLLGGCLRWRMSLTRA